MMRKTKNIVAGAALGAALSLYSLDALAQDVHTIDGKPAIFLDDTPAFRTAIGIERSGSDVYVVLRPADRRVSVDTNKDNRFDGTYTLDNVLLQVLDRDPGATFRNDRVAFGADGRARLTDREITDGKFVAFMYGRPGTTPQGGGRLPDRPVAILSETYTVPESRGAVAFGGGAQAEPQGQAPQAPPQGQAPQAPPQGQAPQAPPQGQAPAGGQQAPAQGGVGFGPIVGGTQVGVQVAPAQGQAPPVATAQASASGGDDFSRRFDGAVRGTFEIGDAQSRFTGSRTGYGGVGWGVDGVVGVESEDGSSSFGVYGEFTRRDFDAGDINNALSIGTGNRFRRYGVGLTGRTDLAPGERAQLNARLSFGWSGQDLRFNYLGNEFGEDAQGVRATGSVALPRLFISGDNIYWGIGDRFYVEALDLVQTNRSGPQDVDAEYGWVARARNEVLTNIGGRVNGTRVDAAVGWGWDTNYTLAWREDLSVDALERLSRQQARGEDLDLREFRRDNVTGHNIPAYLRVSPESWGSLYVAANGVIPVGGDLERVGAGLEFGGDYGFLSGDYSRVSAEVAGERLRDSRFMLNAGARFDLTDLLVPRRPNMPDLR